MSTMKTSSDGIKFLERHEGVVLKAYRDPVGILTIGAGLTKASGVINPRPGQVITNAQASDLLAKALERNYEPRVRKAMPDALQREFDGGVSFDWNTGAIHRASWVVAWRARNWIDVKRRLAMWKKAGGRVLPGLVRRRHEEFELVRFGMYGKGLTHNPPSGYAMFVVDQSHAQVLDLRGVFQKLGYEPGQSERGILRAAVEAFQRDHDLTVDGLIGRATLSTIQRRLDAVAKLKTPVATTAAGGGTATASDEIATGLPDVSAALPSAQIATLGTITAVIGVGLLLWLAWRYRDVVAAKVQNRFPSIAAKLRSF